MKNCKKKKHICNLIISKSNHISSHAKKYMIKYHKSYSFWDPLSDRYVLLSLNLICDAKIKRKIWEKHELIMESI